MRRPRVLFVASHPVQYAAPQLRRLSTDKRLDVSVAFLSLRGAERAHDPDFQIPVGWDVPLLDGYRWCHPRNYSPEGDGESFLSFVNPRLWSVVRRGDFDVVVCYGYRAVSF